MTSYDSQIYAVKIPCSKGQSDLLQNTHTLKLYSLAIFVYFVCFVVCFVVFWLHLDLVVRLAGELLEAAYYRPHSKPQLLRRNACLGTELLQSETPDLSRRVESQRTFQELDLRG